MSSKKIFVAFGATGNQGGSVVRSILSDPVTAAEYEVHAVTRDPSKPAALSLTEKGAKVIKADLDDKDSLREALKGAYAVFAVTDWGFHMMAQVQDPSYIAKDHEIQQGKNVADVSQGELGIQHLIWSSLPNVSKISNGTITGVLHFDSKATVSEYIHELGIPATHLQLGVFTNYLPDMLQPLPATASGRKSYLLAMPFPATTRLPLLSVRQSTGVYVQAILQNRGACLGHDVCAAQALYTLEEMAEVMGEHAGVEVRVAQCSTEDYEGRMVGAGLPGFFVRDMLDNMRFIPEYGFFRGGRGGGGACVSGGRVRELETLAEWVRGEWVRGEWVRGEEFGAFR